MDTITLYTFEDIHGDMQDFTTYDFVEASAYALRRGLLVVGRTYEFTGSAHVADFRGLYGEEARSNDN
jgi:hypothetical protein